MIMLKVLFCALVLADCGNVFVFSRVCFDCVSIRSCDPALTVARKLYKGTLTSENREIFTKALCGYEGNNPKVCCSDFSVKVVSTMVKSEAAVNVPGQTIESRVVDGTYIYEENEQLLPVVCGDIDGSRIVGGRVAKLYEFPWMALIAYNTVLGLDFKCAGSIINSRYILTAAHCVMSNGRLKKIAGVRIGEFNLATDIDCQGDYENMICESKLQNIAVKETIVHEDFTGVPPVQADIALIHLQEPIDFTYNNAEPICLPANEELRNINLAHKNATVAGWGTTENGRASSILLKTDIPILTSDACRNFYDRYSRRNSMNTSFCAGEVMKDSCDGDSGGPLIVEDEYGGVYRYIQYGIVSYGPKQCGSEFPGVYTDVSKYMPWILNKIKN